MKRLLATTMLAAMVALPAFAQGGTPIFTGEKQHQPVTSKNGYFVASPGQLLTSDFIGQPVYNGSIRRRRQYRHRQRYNSGRGWHATGHRHWCRRISGVGEKDVAIGCNHFSWVDKSGGTRWLMVDADKEQLEKAPVFDRNAAFTANGASRAAEKQ